MFLHSISSPAVHTLIKQDRKKLCCDDPSPRVSHDEDQDDQDTQEDQEEKDGNDDGSESNGKPENSPGEMFRTAVSALEKCGTYKNSHLNARKKWII